NRERRVEHAARLARGPMNDASSLAPTKHDFGIDKPESLRADPSFEDQKFSQKAILAKRRTQRRSDDASGVGDLYGRRRRGHEPELSSAMIRPSRLWLDRRRRARTRLYVSARFAASLSTGCRS